jgi:two-component system sensor histidine kinase PilS (NtrC family)
MPVTELRRKLAWLIGIRAVISTGLLGGAIFAQITSPGSFPVDPFFYLIAFTYAATVAYAVTLRFVDRHQWLINVQLGVDALIVSAFISMTGGITSVFSTLYILPIVGASIVQYRRGGLLVATLSAIVYSGLVVGQYFAAAGYMGEPWFATHVVSLPSALVAQYRVALNLVGFFVVAMLSGSLAEGMRTADARLDQASTRIADLQAMNQHVIDSLPSGLATADPARRILTFNRAAEAITGLPFASVVGQPIAEVLHLPPALVESLDRGLDPDGVRRIELRYPTTDGRGEIDIGLSITHLETPSGRAGFLITFQDVTQVKKLERDARLQQRLAAVGEMAAGIAHEIRNPLASMSGSIQILRQELPLSAEQEQLMDIVLRESERLNTTIGSFLAYARPQRFAIARFDVGRTLNDAALLLRNSAEVHEGNAVEVEVPARPLWFEADEGQIKQIVWNLATNGLRAMPDGGRLRLLGAVEPSGGVVITVKDEGIGIPVDALDGLFQPFHGSFAKGSGLGLAIVHRIVTDYSGEIRVSSRPGEGTTVSVRLPSREMVTT